MRSSWKCKITIKNKDEFRILKSITDKSVPCLAITSMNIKSGLSSALNQYEAKRILNEPNAGGSSEISEALSLIFLKEVIRASLVKTEMEINYFPFGSKKTDFIIESNNCKFGVSVSRAMSYNPRNNIPTIKRFAANYTSEHANYLLTKKLTGVIFSSRNVSKRDRWDKQILHIWVPTIRVARILRTEYHQLDDNLKSNTTVIITIVDNELIFSNFN